MALLSSLLSLFGTREGPTPAPSPASSPAASPHTEYSSPRASSCFAIASPRRTSTKSAHASHCTERELPDGSDKRYPVKLVVFDLDETLTLVSYMIEESDTAEVRAELLKVNFETPWSSGSRLVKLRTMFQRLSTTSQGRPRALTVLTRNSAGAEAVLRLLQEAKLAPFFSAVWTMPWRQEMANGVYQEGGQWKVFEPPINHVSDHKADVLAAVANQPAAWFPQLNGAESGLEDLAELKLEGIVLVDDQRSNFQSPSGAQVLRYCKVARYDARYRNIGFCKNMGGIGAHLDTDYDTLKSFVEEPSVCKETLQLHCVERDFKTNKMKQPVRLVVFDFDETLTMATFMPEDVDFAEKLDWDKASLDEAEWTEADLLTYNFESPYVGGSRLKKLRQLLQDLSRSRQGEPRTLTILTRNESGVVAVLNLLKLAQLATFFSVIWNLPYSLHRPSGAFKDATGTWKTFDPPLLQVPDHKADVLQHLAAHPTQWLPQLSELPDGAAGRKLLPESIVLVDDERGNFQSNFGSQAQVLRYCKVARYDEHYRTCGLLNQLGGIGAHSDADFDILRQFIDRPWRFLPEGHSSLDMMEDEEEGMPPGGSSKGVKLQRTYFEEEQDKLPRTRRRKANSSPEIGGSPRNAGIVKETRCSSFSEGDGCRTTEEEDVLGNREAAASFEMVDLDGPPGSAL